MNSVVEVANRMHQLPKFVQGMIRPYGLHVGEYKWSCKNADYEGWVVCDGRPLPVETYHDLYDLIGTQFGGDSEYFYLPDYRGRVMGAVGQGSTLSMRTLGFAVGTETHVLSTNELPSHTHSGTTGPSGIHSHSTNATGGNIGLITSNGTNTASTGLDNTTGEPNLYGSLQALTVNDAGGHSHAFTTNSTGSNVAHQNMQPTLFGGSVFIFTGVFTAVPELLG
jgi:microcystin-dependent protein